MDESTKLINHIGWLFQAVHDQIRFINADVKLANNNPIFHLNPYFVSFGKHLSLTMTLFSQAQKSYFTLIRSQRITKLSLNKIYTIYVQRAIYNEQIAAHNLNQYNFKNDLNATALYSVIYDKTYKLEHMINQLTTAYKKLLTLYQ